METGAAAIPRALPQPASHRPSALSTNPNHNPINRYPNNNLNPNPNPNPRPNPTLTPTPNHPIPNPQQAFCSLDWAAAAAVKDGDVLAIVGLAGNLSLTPFFLYAARRSDPRPIPI